jgi:hypothetical protein
MPAQGAGMSTDRSVRLSPQELALKLATREAIEAAGGQTFLARETGRSQGRFSDYCSDNTAEFMPLQLVRHVEALGAGKPGHPHVTRALARAADLPIGGRGAAQAGVDDLGDWMALVARENADLAAAMAGQDLARCCESLSPHARERLSRETGQLIAVLEGFRRDLDTS